MKIFFGFTLFLISIYTQTNAQQNVDTSGQKRRLPVAATFGKGINFVSTDGLFTLSLGGRIQTMSETKYDVSTKDVTVDFLVRRCRLNIQGTAFHPKFTYRIQLGFAHGDITASNTAEQNNLFLRDAMLYYQASKWLKIGMGQTKLPGNRQRQISSSSLQLVERSIVNNNFTLDRDKGIWLYTTHNAGRSLFKNTLAISSGEGRITSNKNGRLCYSLRSEWLPFGEFGSKGDFVEADVEKEPHAKLSVAVVASANKANTRTLGQLGDYLYNNTTADISYFGGDMLFKLKGFSAETELYMRKSSTGIITDNTSGKKNYVLSGTGFMLQSGIFLSPSGELAVRFAMINPEDKISSVAHHMKEYVLGYSHYFSKHNLKLQTDCTYLINGSAKTIIHRLSGVITF